MLGCLANQGGPIWWASQHRAHHKFCDGERDPHSAEQVGVVKAFVFFDRITNVNEEFAPRHLESLSIRVLDTFAGALLTRSAVQPDLASWLRPWVDAPPEAPPRTAEAEDAAAPVAAPMAADEEWCSIM